MIESNLDIKYKKRWFSHFDLKELKKTFMDER
jgi:hypothetical protein